MIARELETRIKYMGRVYRLNLSFDVVLRLFELHDDDLFDPYGIICLSLEMLAGKRTRRLMPDRKVELYKAIFERFISIPSEGGKGGPDVLDLQQDAPYIYAAFRQAYGIDLVAERGRLDWRLFMALLKGIPEETKLRYIMNVRGRPLPTPTKYNAEQIKAQQEEKRFYAIRRSKAGTETSFQEGLNQLANFLYQQAKGGTK